jgi:hypothetical protein
MLAAAAAVHAAMLWLLVVSLPQLLLLVQSLRG